MEQVSSLNGRVGLCEFLIALAFLQNLHYEHHFLVYGGLFLQVQLQVLNDQQNTLCKYVVVDDVVLQFLFFRVLLVDLAQGVENAFQSDFAHYFRKHSEVSIEVEELALSHELLPMGVDEEPRAHELMDEGNEVHHFLIEQVLR